MSRILVEVPEAAITPLRLTVEALAAEMRLASTIRFYAAGRLSQGEAAEFVGLGPVPFRQKLTAVNVLVYHIPGADLDLELEHG